MQDNKILYSFRSSEVNNFKQTESVYKKDVFETPLKQNNLNSENLEIRKFM
jgi:hypothetical protein